MNKVSQKVDACIIGSGAAGGVVAKELGEQGLKVVVLEAGSRFDPLRDYITARPDWEFAVKGHREKFRVPSLHKVTLGNKFISRPAEAHGVGGGTLRYNAYAYRMQPMDFQIYNIDGVGANWPITYKELVPYYRKVEMGLGVSGLAGDPWFKIVEPYPNPPFEFSYANKIVKRGCDKLGIKLWPAPMARLSRPFDSRPMCLQCGLCTEGCMSGAKSSIDMTYIKKAEASGNVFVRTKSTATRIRIDNEGKAKSVIYFDRDGFEREQKASVIIVSAGTIQSPRLLLNSKSKIFPDGLANSSGLVGKYFMQHIGIYSSALFHDRIDSFRGHPSGASSLDFAKSSPTNSFARGWRVDLISGVTTPKMLTNRTSLSGKRLKDYMRTNFGHSAGIITAGEQLPDERNFIELDPEVKDEYGLAVPRINYKWRKNDRSMLAAMEKKIREIYDAAGAYEIQYIHSRQGGSSHNMGTCRMGKDRKTSVLNSYCQSHDVSNLFVIDGSCFVTASSVNPSLTIQAIALRASEYIVEQGKKGNLMKL